MAFVNIGMAMLAIWFVQTAWKLIFGGLWFIGMPTIQEQITYAKAVCEEKKRREDFENSLLEQQMQELNSAVANVASSQHTSS